MSTTKTKFSSPGRFIPFCRDSITERFSSLQISSFTSPQINSLFGLPPK